MTTSLSNHDPTPGARPSGVSDPAAAAQSIQKMFDAIAPRYDLLKPLLSAGIEMDPNLLIPENNSDGGSHHAGHVRCRDVSTNPIDLPSDCCSGRNGKIDTTAKRETEVAGSAGGSDGYARAACHQLWLLHAGSEKRPYKRLNPGCLKDNRRTTHEGVELADTRRRYPRHGCRGGRDFTTGLNRTAHRRMTGVGSLRD